MFHSYQKLTPKEPLIHCKACRGVLLVIDKINKADERTCLECRIRCPHCKKDWHICFRLGETPHIRLADEDAHSS